MHLCIVGTSRSGSTLLRELINAHPDVRLLNETHWIPRMVEFFGLQRVHWSRLLDVASRTTWDSGRTLLDVNAALWSQDTDVMVGALSAKLASIGNLDIAHFHDVLAETCMGTSGGTVWGDKTPDYGFHMSTIQAIWPRCRFVHIIRDGAPTARSMSKHRGCQLMISAGYDNWCSLSYDSIYTRYQLRPLPLKAFVESWCRRMSRIRDESRRLKANTYLEVRYENLLEQPALELAGIGDWIGLASNDAWTKSAEDVVRSSRATTPLALEVLFQLPVHDLLQIRELDQSGSTGDLKPSRNIPWRVYPAKSENDWEQASRQALGALCDAIHDLDQRQITNSCAQLVECIGTRLPLMDSTLFCSLGEKFPMVRQRN
jgi:hypothetical protein